jgi:hypothetical protein
VLRLVPVGSPGRHIYSRADRALDCNTQLTGNATYVSTRSVMAVSTRHDYARTGGADSPQVVKDSDFLCRDSFIKSVLPTLDITHDHSAHAFVVTLTNDLNALSVFFNLGSFPIMTVTPSRLHVCSTKPSRRYSQLPYSLYHTTTRMLYMAWNDFHTLSHLPSSNMFLTLFAMAFRRLFRSYGIKDLVGRYKVQTKI